jgi:RNA-directed DNA polymerase
LEAVRALTFDLQDGRDGSRIEADIHGFCDHMDQTWLLAMVRLRIDDRAFLRRMHQWLQAGMLDTDGPGVHPETGTPQGGTGSPVLAKVSLPYALDLGCAQVVKPHGRGAARLCR